MSKLLVVFGVTGQQGGSVAEYVLADPELSKQFKVRGVTRDPSKPAAQALQQKGVEVMAGDLADAASVKQALEGAHTVFAVTFTIYAPGGKEEEIRQGKAVADAAVAAGAKAFIWSSQKDTGAIIGQGKGNPVSNFDSKAAVEAYVRTLPIQGVFFAPGAFMQNLLGMSAPRPVGDGTYAIANVHTPETLFPWIDVAGDTGKWVGAALAEPDKLNGKFLAASSGLLSLTEATEILSKVTGKTVKYNQLPVEVYKGFLPPGAGDAVVDMFLFMQDYGYYGPDMEKEVEWTASQARGKLTSLEDFLAKNAPKLE